MNKKTFFILAFLCAVLLILFFIQGLRIETPLNISWSAIHVSSSHAISSAEIRIQGTLIQNAGMGTPDQLRLWEGGLYLDGQVLTNFPIPLNSGSYSLVHSPTFEIIFGRNADCIVLKQANAFIIAPATSTDEAIAILERILSSTDHNSQACADFIEPVLDILNIT